MWTVAAYRQTHRQRRLDLRLHSSIELRELSQWLCHDNSTIKVGMGRPNSCLLQLVALLRSATHPSAVVFGLDTYL